MSIAEFQHLVDQIGLPKALARLKEIDDIPRDFFDGMNLAALHLFEIEPDVFLWMISSFTMKKTILPISFRVTWVIVPVVNVLLEGPRMWRLRWYVHRSVGRRFRF